MFGTKRQLPPPAHKQFSKRCTETNLRTIGHKPNVEPIITRRHIASHHVTSQRSCNACTKQDTQKQKRYQGQKIISRPLVDSYSYDHALFLFNIILRGTSHKFVPLQVNYRTLVHSVFTRRLLFLRFIAKKVGTACWRANNRTVPVTNLNKYLYNNKC